VSAWCFSNAAAHALVAAGLVVDDFVASLGRRPLPGEKFFEGG
jgi:hypothetical protein